MHLQQQRASLPAGSSRLQPGTAAQRRRRWTSLAPAAAAATTAATTSPAARQEDPYTQLARLCDASGPVAVGTTARGGRGLLLQQDMPEREALLTVPLANALIIADEPVSGISIFSDRQHRQWQELHGELPPMLLEFLQGDARWDARMAGWLLWMVRHPSPMWSAYLALLPTESEMSCLLNFSQAEAEQLQVPRLKEEAGIQAGWCAHLHAKYFSTVTGSLAPLRLSDGLAHSLWAISLVRSRTFSEDVNGEMLTLMVPFCDMANHCSNHNSTFCINRDLKSFSLRSLRPLKQGQELTITYGAEKPNCEALRDYGFVLAGNAHDRISWGQPETNEGGGAAEGASTGDKGSSSSLSRLYGLNEACLMEAAGFTGDLAAGDILPLPSSAQPPPLSPDQQQQLARREAALLSMPLKGAPGSSSEGGLMGWLDNLAQPWTDSGKPPPQPLQRQQVPAERAAIQALQQQLAQQLEQLPTSIETDWEVLRQLELYGAGVVFGDGSSESMPSVNQQGATSSPAGSDSSGDSVQQRRQGRLLQQTAGAAPRPMSLQQQLEDGGRGSPSTARLMAAVRTRLEHKLLLQEGLGVLQQYSQHLTAQFGA